MHTHIWHFVKKRDLNAKVQILHLIPSSNYWIVSPSHPITAIELSCSSWTQIYQLMKMDCYPRFKKSPLVKECLLAEMEGNPLPIDLPQQDRQQNQQQTQQYAGIWKKHRVCSQAFEVNIRFTFFSPLCPGIWIWTLTLWTAGTESSAAGTPPSPCRYGDMGGIPWRKGKRQWLQYSREQGQIETGQQRY